MPSGSTDPDFSGEAPNQVTDVYGTVGGGYASTMRAMMPDDLDAPFATVGGGFRNAASDFGSTVAGGSNNTASGASSTVAGGSGNEADASPAASPGAYRTRRAETTA